MRTREIRKERTKINERGDKREWGTKEWGMRKFAFLPASRIIDVGKVDGDPSSPAAPSLAFSKFIQLFLYSKTRTRLFSHFAKRFEPRAAWITAKTIPTREGSRRGNKCNLNSFGIFNAARYLN